MTTGMLQLKIFKYKIIEIVVLLQNIIFSAESPMVTLLFHKFHQTYLWRNECFSDNELTVLPW